MKGIIMAGGEGSRLRPLTCDLPKPMVPVMNRPVMSYSIELLKKYRITDIGVTLQYLPEEIQDYFQNGTDFGVHLNYFIEDSPLGTAGSVKNSGDFLDETFVVISGDALTDINLEKAIKFHKDNGSIATLILKRVEVPLEFGVVVTDEEGSIKRFLEKPNWGEVFSDTVNTGIYILEPEVLDYFEAGKKFDFSQDLFPLLLKDQRPMFGYITNEYWCDIGNSQTYLSAHYDMLSGRVNIPMPGRKTDGDIWLGENVQIHKDAKLEGPCFIGDYSKIGKDVYIGPYTVVGSNCSIDSGSSIKKSILWNHVVLGEKTAIRGAALCNKVDAANRVSVFEGAIIGDGCQLKEGSVIKPLVKIWPNKTVDEGNIIQSNIIWGTKSAKTLFGKDGIYGAINIDLTPQTTTRIGAAFGAYLKPGKRVAVSSDNHQGNSMLKYSIISGLLSSGLEVFDIGQLTTPVLRYAVKYLALDGGIHLFSTTENPREGHIHFVDAFGCNLPPSIERKIENLYIRDDFQRQNPEDIKRVHTLSDIPVFYIRSLMDGLNIGEMKKQNYNILISSKGSRLSSYILHRVLNETGCKVTKCNRSLEEEMKYGKYDLGCIMDPNGESFVLFDESGTMIDKEMQKALVSLIYLKDKPGDKMAVPNTASGIMEKLAADYDCSVVRTKSSRQAIMEEVYKDDQNNERNSTKLFPLYFDGTAALIKLIELLAREKVSLSKLTQNIPKFYMCEKEIKCPWTAKGRVMRSLIEEEGKGSKEIELFEGIRINHDNGWALILPDSDEPICRVYSEGFSEEYAEELATIYEKKIQEIL